MKPSDIIDLPTRHSSVWHDAPGRAIEAAFGMKIYDLDEARGAEHKGPTVSVLTKLSNYINQDNSTSIDVLTYDGVAFGIYAYSGEDSGYEEFYLTDASVFELARIHMESMRIAPLLSHVDATDDGDVPALSSFPNVELVAFAGKVRMVQPNRLSRNGVLVFDDDAFDLAFDEHIRSVFVDEDSRRTGFCNRLMREAAAKAFDAAVPHGVDHVMVGDFEGGTRALPRWLGTVMSTDEGTYAAGISGHYTTSGHFSWASGSFVTRIGGPEMIDLFRQEHEEVAGPRP